MPIMATVLILITGFIVEAALDILQNFIGETLKARYGWGANPW